MHPNCNVQLVSEQLDAELKESINERIEKEREAKELAKQLAARQQAARQELRAKQQARDVFIRQVEEKLDTLDYKLHKKYKATLKYPKTSLERELLLLEREVAKAELYAASNLFSPALDAPPAAAKYELFPRELGEWFVPCGKRGTLTAYADGRFALHIYRACVTQMLLRRLEQMQIPYSIPREGRALLAQFSAAEMPVVGWSLYATRIALYDAAEIQTMQNFVLREFGAEPC